MRKAIVILLMLLPGLMGTAQNREPGELHLNHLFIKDGLPEGTVTALLQDKEGYIWIGTQKGLVRYDGYKPKVYTLGATNPFVLIISKLYQDSRGRLWVGTQDAGLYLYDRASDRFINYVIDSANATLHRSAGPGGFITDIHDDEDGNIWATATSWQAPENKTKHFALYLFNPRTKKIEYFGKGEKGKHYINTSYFFKLFVDKKGHIWVSSDHGLYEYDNQTGGFVRHPASSGYTQQMGFSDIYQEPSHPNMLWITNANLNLIYQPIILLGKGLWRYNISQDSATAFLHHPDDPNSIASDTVFAVQNDTEGHLWIGTGNGISLYNRAKENFINYQPDDGKSNAIRELKEDKNGNLWCATPDGLLLFNTGTRKFIRYTAGTSGNDALVSNAVHNLFIDQSGTLWFGVLQTGLQWINEGRSKFTQYSNNPGQPHYFQGGTVNCFAESKDGTIWISSQHGLYSWQPSTDSFKNIKLNQKIAFSSFSRSIIADSKGYIWFGAKSGLYRYDPRTGKTKNFRYDKNDTTSLSNNIVFALVEDHLGNIWVGTFGGGLCRFNRKSQNFVRYPYIKNIEDVTTGQGGTDNDEINVLYEDKGGTLWVGTNLDGSLDSLNRKTGKFTSFAKSAPGFATVLYIYEDNKDRLWVGTFLEGLYRLNRKRDSVIRYGEKDGLLYDGVLGILEDRKGNLWLSSMRGISILNPQTRQVSILTGANGIPSENLYDAFKTNSGRFLFATDNGFISLNPDDFTPDPHPPIVHIESVDFINPGDKYAKDSSIVAFGKNDIEMPYNENRLTFHYVGLHYQNTAMIRYVYKLDGYDNRWIQAGTERSVTYTNLSPGTYTFEVKAANSDGVWSVKNPSLRIIITPPWWRTWWAYLLYGVIFVLIVWAFITYRSRRLKKANRMLEKQVTSRTSELKQSLEDLKSTQKQLIQSEKMASLGELTAGIAHEIQNPLNFVNNFSEVNTEMLVELKAERLKPKAERDEQTEDDIINDVIDNSEKINHHGKRAGDIVKGMLQHSQKSTGVKEPTDINALADEYLRLSYHGLRAKDKGFNATMKTDFDSSIGKLNIIPQDIGRVLLNLYNNAFYAVKERHASTSSAGQSYEPTVSVTTKKSENHVIITVKDNGNGIPQKIVDKIFQPFFTTKPTGSGTGLGLSLSYDIIKAHGGEIKVESKEGEGTEFIIRLPFKENF